MVAGYTRGEGRRASSIGALVLAVNEGGALRWVGNAGSGFGDAEIERLLALLRPLERPTSPFPAPPKMPRVRKGDVVWVEPRLVAEIAFGEWTRDGRLRHPRYVGLRDDKPAREVRRERPAEDVVRKGKRELRLTNLDKVFWPDEGITKGELVDYYRQVAPVLVPHLRNRPFTMRRYPDGIDGKAFFQKDAPVAHARLDPDVPRARLAARAGEGEARGRVPARERRAGAAVDGQHGLHRHEPVVLAGRPPRPPGLRALRPRPDAGGAVVARRSRSRCSCARRSSWSASSRSRRHRGGKGFHVLVPIDRRSTYDDARSFAELVASAHRARAPGPRDAAVVEGASAAAC